MPDSGFIAVRGLHKKYRDGMGNVLHILRGIDLEIAERETVSIMGASNLFPDRE